MYFLITERNGRSPMTTNRSYSISPFDDITELKKEIIRTAPIGHPITIDVGVSCVVFGFQATPYVRFSITNVGLEAIQEVVAYVLNQCGTDALDVSESESEVY